MFFFCVHRVVLQFTGVAIRSERLKGDNLAALITDNKDTLSVKVAEVSVGKSDQLMVPMHDIYSNLASNFMFMDSRM